MIINLFDYVYLLGLWGKFGLSGKVCRTQASVTGCHGYGRRISWPEWFTLQTLVLHQCLKKKHQLVEK